MRSPLPRAVHHTLAQARGFRGLVSVSMPRAIASSRITLALIFRGTSNRPHARARMYALSRRLRSSLVRMSNSYEFLLPGKYVLGAKWASRNNFSNLEQQLAPTSARRSRLRALPPCLEEARASAPTSFGGTVLGTRRRRQKRRPLPLRPQRWNKRRRRALAHLRRPVAIRRALPPAF